MRWTVAVESAARAIHAEGDLVAVGAALRSDGLAFAVAVGGHAATGTIRASFAVDAESIETAAAIGVRAFHRALHAAGVSPSTNRLELARAVAPVERKPPD